MQIPSRRDAPIRAVPPSGAQAAPCKRKIYLEYKKLGVNAAPQPTLYNLAIKRIFRAKKVKDVSGAADARNGVYESVPVKASAPDIARRRAYFYDYKGFMTQKPMLKSTHTSVPSPESVPEPCPQPKIVCRRAYFHYREVV